MSAKRICLNCGGDIPQQRQSGAKYCNDSCKARYHEKKLMKQLFSGETQKINPLQQEKKEAVKNMLTGLEGVAERKVHPQLSAPQTQYAATQSEVKNNAENGVQSVQYAKSDQKKEVSQEPALIPLIIKVETEKYKLVKEKLNVVYKEYDRVKGMIKSCDEQIEKINRTKDFSLLPMTTAGAGGILVYNNADKKMLPTAGGAIAGWAAGNSLTPYFLKRTERKKRSRQLSRLETRQQNGRNILRT